MHSALEDLKLVS